MSARGAHSFHLSSRYDVTPQTFWRAASISKIVTGQAARSAFQAAGIGFDTPVQDVLGVPFRTPHRAAPTLTQLASHQSGLWDAGGYVVPADVRLSDWLTARGDAIWSGAAPGARFDYSNLGYLVLAACAEQVAGRSFDDVCQQAVLSPLGVTAGFNWAGVPAEVAVLPTYRRTMNGFVAQIDAPRADAPAGEVGAHTARFSPQGGLRISLEGAVRLAEALGGTQERLWMADAARTNGPADLFQHYGWGLQIYDKPAFYPRPLIGHFANAYGFCGGVWHDAAAGLSFAYALNGLAQGDEDDGLRPEERAIFQAVAAVA